MTQLRSARAVMCVLLGCLAVVCYGDEHPQDAATKPSAQQQLYRVYRFACDRSAWPPEVALVYAGRGPITPAGGPHSSYGFQPRPQDDLYLAVSPISRYCILAGDPVRVSTADPDQVKLSAASKSCADRSAEYVKLHKACPVGSRPITQPTEEDPPRTPIAARILDGESATCYQLCEDAELKAK
jgi:hypothetical protein